MLPWTPRFIFRHSIDLTLSLPVTRWNPGARTTGRTLYTATGVQGVSLRMRKYTLAFQLRFYESEWESVSAFIAAAQTGHSFLWCPNAMDGGTQPSTYRAFLDFPDVRDGIKPTRDSAFTSLFTLPIVLARRDAPWNAEYFKAITSDGIPTGPLVGIGDPFEDFVGYPPVPDVPRGPITKPTGDPGGGPGPGPGPGGGPPPDGGPPIASRPLVGAIRFDGWSHDNAADPTLINYLLGLPGGPAGSIYPNPDYRERWPYFVQTAGPSMDEGVQSVIDTDIQYASAAGINFWIYQSFCTAETYAHDLHMTSPYKNLMKFAKAESTFNECRVLMTLDWLNDPQYLVYNGRPVIFCFTNYFRQFGITGAMVAAYRQRIMDAGHQNPYLVALDFDTAASPRTDNIDVLGLDALSLYSGGQFGLSIAAHPYSEVAALQEAQWIQYRNTGKPYVPTITLGYDNRDAGRNDYSELATPTEVANHLQNGVNFVKANPTMDPANLLVIYAWNEYTENGILSPFNPATNPQGRARLDAVGAVLNSDSVPVSITIPPTLELTA